MVSALWIKLINVLRITIKHYLDSPKIYFAVFVYIHAHSLVTLLGTRVVKSWTISSKFCKLPRNVGKFLDIYQKCFTPCLNGSGWWWWCNGVGDIFLAHFGPLSTNWASFQRRSLPEYCCCHVHPFMTTVFPSSDGYFQQDNARYHSSNHLRLVSWTWQWVHFTWMPSTITSSQSSLWCGGTGDSHHGCAADKSAATAWCYHVNMHQNLWEMFPTPSWIYATKNQGSSEGKRGSNPVLARWQDGSMLSCSLCQILSLSSECRSRYRDSSDQATLFQSSIVQFLWACPNCSLCFLFLADRSGTRCGLLLL